MGTLRHALTTKAGVAVVAIVLALIGTPTLLGVGRGRANDVHPAGASQAGPRVAAGTPVARRAPVAARLVPFTSFDMFLLAAGGAALLVCGANAGRRSRRVAETAEVQRAQA